MTDFQKNSNDPLKNEDFFFALSAALICRDLAVSSSLICHSKRGQSIIAATILAAVALTDCRIDDILISAPFFAHREKIVVVARE